MPKWHSRNTTHQHRPTKEAIDIACCGCVRATAIQQLSESDNRMKHLLEWMPDGGEIPKTIFAIEKLPTKL